MHSLAGMHNSFDDPHLAPRAGPVPVAALAQRAGLDELAAEQVTPCSPCGVNAERRSAAWWPGWSRGGQHR